MSLNAAAARCLWLLMGDESGHHYSSSVSLLLLFLLPIIHLPGTGAHGIHRLSVSPGKKATKPMPLTLI